MQTSITIRPAARGGKFLGPDAADANGNSAVVLVRSLVDGEILALAPLNGGSGPCQMMQPFSRNQPIPTAVTSPPATVSYVLQLDISEPTPLELAVLGPLSSPSQLGFAEASIVALPGIDLGGLTSANPEGVVLEIPGLCVATASYGLSGGVVTANAFVSMMCGCKIQFLMPCQPQSFIPWPASDFVVQFIGQAQSGASIRFPLTIANTPSTFQGSAPYNTSDPVVSGAVWAWQPSLGNTGWQQASSAGQVAKGTISPAILARFPELTGLIASG
jgi:hypothetical protein